MGNPDFEQDNEHEEEDTSSINLWERILSEASRSVSDHVESRTALILGDRNSGKSTLMARVQGLDIRELKKGVALDYSFIDVFSSPEDDDPVSRINVWQLEGDIEYSNLLRFALNPQTVEHSVIVIALDLSQPWYLVESLKKWLTVIEKHLSTVFPQLSAGLQDELKNSQVLDIQTYTEPTDVGVNGDASTLAVASTGTSTLSLPKTPRKKKHVDEQTLLPLPEGVLRKNLGVPIVVTVCKTDYMVQLEKEYSYKESHFDYIQQYLRRICLEYGAALIYTSAKKDINCDIFLSYLRHRLYGFDFNVKTQLLEKETIFVPTGADSFNKIKVDFENQSLSKDADEPFEDIITVPKRLQQMEASSIDPLVLAEDDQEFLSKYKETIEKEDAKDKDKKKSGFLSSLQKLGGGSVTGEGQATTTTPPTAVKSQSALPSTAEKSSPTSALPPMAADSKAEPATEHQVLANFFNSLIQKDRPSAAALGTSAPGTTTRKPIDLAKIPNAPATKGSSTPLSREDVAKQLDKLKKQIKP